MGISTHIQGFKAPDAKWKALKAVWDSCKAAGIEPPEAVGKFFEWEEPDERGVELKLKGTECCEEWSDDYRSGYEIDVKKLPANVTHIRFYNSY